MDGSLGYQLVQNGCKRLDRINQPASQGAVLGFLLFTVELLADQALADLLSCTGEPYTTCSFATRWNNHTSRAFLHIQ